MDEFKVNFADSQFIRYFKAILIAALVVVEILICVQYASVYQVNRNVARLVAVVSLCVALALLESINSFAAYKKFSLQMVFYSFETVLLFAICLLTGNSYLSMLYVVILTQFYVSVADLKSNATLFGVSCCTYIGAFVVGWVIINEGSSVYDSIAEILGGCVFGVFILGLDFAVINFIINFYRTNLRLHKALEEANESKNRLQEVYEQLSHAAVFEERNRIAKDIHDNAGHSITTVIMQTEAAKLLIDTNPQEAKNSIISANIQAKSALEQMRESVHLLAGRAQSKTLKEEIEEIIAQTIDGTSLKIRCDIDDIAVPEEQFRFFCNTVKEGLANGIRHGSATAFYIELKSNFNEIMLLISDNGNGVNGEVQEGFGLRGVREKAEKLGGKCNFSSERGEGFEIEVILPVKGGDEK